MPSPVSNDHNPFPGLRSFEREQAHLFFGRDEQIDELLVRLKLHRFLPIVGVSGSGKSSLVRAGLIPALTFSESARWRIVMLRPGRNPLHELAATLCKEFDIDESDIVLQNLRGSSGGLARIAKPHLGDSEKLLVLVDQFEELFRYREEAIVEGETGDDAAFVKALLAAAGETEHPLPGFEQLPVYVVTTMRSDFLGKCSRFRGLPEALNQSQYLIPRLTRDQQREVIEGPIRMANAFIEPALVQRLLNDLGDDPDQLPALQHALMRTWEQAASIREKGKLITVADYEAVGGMADALNRDADRVYGSLSDNDAAITRRLFQRLVQPGGPESETRSPTPLSELIAVTGADEADVKRVITAFQDRGFLTVSHDSDPIIDITHESLIRGWKRLATWVQEEARSAAIYKRLAQTPELYATGRTSLLVDPELHVMHKWRDETRPNEAWATRYDSRFTEAMAFLEQSLKEHQASVERAEHQRRAQLKRAWLIALLLGILLFFAITGFVFALFQQKRAIAERQKAVAERDRSSRLLYDANVYSASAAVASGQFTVARERLAELLDAGLRELRGFEWFYLWRAVNAHEATLSGHSAPVFSVAFSPDGKILASAADDKTVKLWDTTARKETATLSGHSASVRSVAFSPDGKTLASASYDKTLKLWDTTARQEIATLYGHSAAVLSVAFSPDGKILASSSDDKTVKLWDTATRQEIATLPGHSGSVWSVAFSPDGKTLASGSYDKTVKLWEIEARKEIATISDFNYVWSVAFSPDGKILASGNYDNRVTLWETATRKPLGALSGHSGSVWSVDFSSDGKTLASASNDNTLRLWDIDTRQAVALPGHSGYVWSVAFSPDGKTLASVSNDKTVKLWNTTTGKGLDVLTGHSNFIRSVAFSPDSKTLASASYDKTVKLWDTTARKEIATLSSHSGTVWSVAFSPDGKILASASDDRTVKLWDTTARNEIATLSSHSGTVWSVAFSPDGKTLASASDDKTVKLWDTTARKEIATLSGHSDAIWSVAFSPDGKTLVSASRDNTLKLWDIATSNEVATLSGHSDSVWSVAFSPDGKTLASAGYDNTVKLWDTATRKEVATLYGHSGYVWSVAFSPDGKTLASTSNDGTVKLWTIATRKEVATLPRDFGSGFSVAFSPDGKTLASGGFNTVKLWFAATEEEVERRQRGY